MNLRAAEILSLIVIKNEKRQVHTLRERDREQRECGKGNIRQRE